MDGQWETLQGLRRWIDQLDLRPPVDIEAVARRLGVVEISPRPIDFDGYLARRPDGNLAIRYRQDSRLARRRFTIAHEIGHILLSQETGEPFDSPVARRPLRDNSEERLANRIAAELLLPERHISAMLRSSPVRLWAIRRIANCFDVSAASVFFRVSELRELPFIKMTFDSTARRRPVVKSNLFGPILFTTPPAREVARLASEMTAPARRISEHSIQIVIGGSDESRCFAGTSWSVGARKVAQVITWGQNLNHAEFHIPGGSRLPLVLPEE